VVARARYRRHHRLTTVLTVTTVFLTGMAGGLSLRGQGIQERIFDIATGIVTTSTPTSTATPTPEASRKDRKRATKTPTAAVRRSAPTRESATALAVPTPAPRAALAVHGRAVSTDGKPVAGLYVYPGRPGADGFEPVARPAGRTAADGRFSLACTRTPVLLSPWPVNSPAVDAGAATWAATFVGGATAAAGAPKASCNRSGRVTETVVQQGSALEGTASMPIDCVDETHSLWLWLHNDRGLTVRVQGLSAGGTFRIAGLPPGQHTVGANGNRTTVTVGGGETLTRDVTFRCEVGTPETPSPTPSATPIPTPSEPTTPVPAPSSPTGTSSPTATSSPTGSTAEKN
jgi:hypothetical protein